MLWVWRSRVFIQAEGRWGFDLEKYHTIYFNDPFQLDNDILDSQSMSANI